jgi:hypothetical protein
MSESITTYLPVSASWVGVGTVSFAKSRCAGAAVAGTQVAISVGAASSVPAAGALHPTNNIPIMSSKYLIFIARSPYVTFY